MQKSIFSNNIFKIHSIVWLCYTLYYGIIILYFNDIPFSYNYVIGVCLLRIGDILFFYAIAFWALPKYLNSKFKYLLTLIIPIVVICYLGYRYFVEAIVLVNLDIQSLKDINISRLVSLAIFNASNFIIFALGYHFAQRVIQQQKEIAQKDLEIAEEKAKNAILEKEKSEAELAFLRSQINPHFMFNTLNMIYNKVRKANQEAGAVVIKFANMMRYATSTKLQANEVDVRGELDFVKEYLNIHKLRFKDAVYIDYDEEGYMLSHRVVPMVLITLVENAVKHGAIDDPNFPLIIRASLIDDYFMFMVHNLKNKKPNGLDQKGNTGVGIVNIEKRLAAVYKNGGYSLEKEETADDYIVTFTVNFKETKI